MPLSQNIKNALEKCCLTRGQGGGTDVMAVSVITSFSHFYFWAFVLGQTD